MYPKNILFLTLLLCLGTTYLNGQANHLTLAPPDLAVLAKEDATQEHQRFSAPLAVDVVPENYTYADGEVHWQQTFTVPGTRGLALFLDSLKLPADARLEMTSTAGTRGPFTQADASELGRLFTGFLPGESVTLAYHGSMPDTIPFRVWRVDHVYRPELWGGGNAKGFGDSNACQINANCPEGDGWEDEKSGAARINIVVAEGVGFCSGSLLNNTARDGRPLLLTGFHCMDGFTPLYDMWRIDFGYAAASCTTPSTEPTPENAYTGVRQLAGRRENDFLLLEIIDVDFATEDHYFAGWDRSDGDVTGVVRHFHHPQGDIQKTALSGNVGMDVFPRAIEWNTDLTTPPNHHFEVELTTGSYEIGSSGSAFFDENRRVRGQLSGGRMSCDGENVGFIGRLHLSWNAGDSLHQQLRPWLDPLGTNAMTLDGETLLPKRFVSGLVLTAGGNPAAGAVITFAWAGGGSQEYVVNQFGIFRGERPVTETGFAISGVYQEDGPLEAGVDVGDIITIRRHILGLDTLSPLRLLVSDTNNSGTLRVSDISRITRVILGIDDWRGRPNWLVLPLGFPLVPTPVDPETPIGIALNNAGVFDLAVNFIVVKTGDADGNVD
ncbi:MAG: hypothetical protein AAFZ52_06050 [Bacteroidota bacterium]